MARAVFMGTPRFAVPTLQALCRHHEVIGVVTQPDRPAGRGRAVVASPVKEEALGHSLPVFQPTSLRSPAALRQLAEWQPQIVVVAAFGQILPRQVLDLPPHGCLNVHASLLPLYRGAAPIPAAILAGETVTGITIMRMDEGLDTGPILAQAKLRIAPDDTSGSLTPKLADLGAALLDETLPAWMAGEIVLQPQDPGRATFCRPLKKEDGKLDWTRPAAELDRRVRACHPWPGAYTFWQGRPLKITRTRPWSDAPVQESGAWPKQPGKVLTLPHGIGVVTGEGLLEIHQVQPAGKKPMAAEAFARGQRDLVGSCLGA
jgi:methionyl-tRNA formyltransferase